MKRRFRYDPQTKTMVEIGEEPGYTDGVMVRGDIADFVSPLDGSLVSGAAARRDHMRKHNVVPFEAGSERVAPRPQDRQARREQIWESVDRAIQQQKRRR